MVNRVWLAGRGIVVLDAVLNGQNKSVRMSTPKPVKNRVARPIRELRLFSCTLIIPYLSPSFCSLLGVLLRP